MPEGYNQNLQQLSALQVTICLQAHQPLVQPGAWRSAKSLGCAACSCHLGAWTRQGLAG